MRKLLLHFCNPIKKNFFIYLFLRILLNKLNNNFKYNLILKGVVILFNFRSGKIKLNFYLNIFLEIHIKKNDFKLKKNFAFQNFTYDTNLQIFFFLLVCIRFRNWFGCEVNKIISFGKSKELKGIACVTQHPIILLKRDVKVVKM